MTRARAAHPRALLLVPGGVALVAGLNGALLLLGLPAPVSGQRVADVHGPLMVLGFVGTVIALERAVALRRGAGYLTPALLGGGGLVLLSPAPLPIGQSMLLLGAIALLVLYRAIWRRSPSLPLTIEMLGAGCACGAAALWLLGAAVPFLAPWLTGFLILTILGERLELSSIGSGTGSSSSRTHPWIAGLASLWLLAATLALVLPDVGYRMLGATLVTLVILAAAGDIARRTIRTDGLRRYMAAAMLAGYLWLGVAGLIWLLAGPLWQGRGYDAVLHAVFLGFVMSMIMAHAPVILPAVLRRPLPYRPLLWVPLLLLHISLVVRLLVGDAWDVPAAVAVGGVANIVAVIAFVVLAAICAIGGEPRAGRARVADAPSMLALEVV